MNEELKNNADLQTEEKYLRLVPEISDAMLEKNEALQADLRKVYGNAKQNMQQKLLFRNRLIIEENKVYLSALLTSLKNTVSDTDKSYLKDLIILKGEETAEALCEIGEFNLAKQFTLNPRKKALFDSYRAAMELDDNAHCEHPKYKLIEDSTTEKVNNYFREKDIFSPKHGRIVSIIRCNECEFRNIKQLPEDLARASRIRAEYALQQAGKSS